MTDLSDFKRLVYEPEIGALREQLAAAVARLADAEAAITIARIKGLDPDSAQRYFDERNHWADEYVAAEARVVELERERDEARATADGMARAPYGEFEAMREARDEALAVVVRQRQALQHYENKARSLFIDYGGECPDAVAMFLDDVAAATDDLARLAGGEQTKDSG